MEDGRPVCTSSHYRRAEKNEKRSSEQVTDWILKRRQWDERRSGPASRFWFFRGEESKEVEQAKEKILNNIFTLDSRSFLVFN